MKNKPRPEQERVVSQNGDSTLQLIWSMADTTWRMFTPPALFVPAGIFADLKLETKPWLTFLAAALGLTCSILLVRQQLKGVK